MAQFGASIQTATVTTGNYQTTIDPYVSGFAGYPPTNGARNPLGARYYDSTGTFSNPYGAPGVYRYVRYNSASNPAITPLTAPAPVYWTDTTFTTVSAVPSESVGGINLVAGIMMPNTTSIPGLNNTALNGNFIWICVGGYLTGVLGVTATVAGDSIIGGASIGTVARVAANTASTNTLLGIALSAFGTPAAGLINLLVKLEN